MLKSNIDTSLPRRRMASSTGLRCLSSFFLLLLAFNGLAGCTSIRPTLQQSGADEIAKAQTQDQTQQHLQRGLAIARDLVGAPYQYGGASPRGFDCSGLVYYAYREAGVSVPRTTKEQYRQSRRLDLSEVRPGDLVFFAISRDKPSHVGIYAGGGRFIHAPSTGKPVGYASLHDPYWNERLIGAGRFQ